MVCAVIVGKKEGESNMAIDLTQMRAGECGKIVELHGGRGMILKLEAMGIRQGVKITKISSQIMRGPVIVKVGNTQVAIGFGMARRVLVNTDISGD